MRPALRGRKSRWARSEATSGPRHRTAVAEPLGVDGGDHPSLYTPRALFFDRVEEPRMGSPRGGCFARLVAAVLRWGVRFRFDAFCLGSDFFMTFPLMLVSTHPCYSHAPCRTR